MPVFVTDLVYDAILLDCIVLGGICFENCGGKREIGFILNVAGLLYYFGYDEMMDLGGHPLFVVDGPCRVWLRSALNVPSPEKRAEDYINLIE